MSFTAGKLKGQESVNIKELNDFNFLKIWDLTKARKLKLLLSTVQLANTRSKSQSQLLLF